MLPIFKEYRNMLNDNGIDLSEYDDNKLQIDRMIIKGFDKSGKERKICKLKVVGDYKNLRYEQTFYYKDKMRTSIQFITAAILAVGGLVLLFCGAFIAPQGEIHESLLVGFGEVATFAGALFGIDYTYKFKQKHGNNTPKQDESQG